MGKTYRIGEAAKALELETYVLRFWETEFRQLTPLRTAKGQRAYTEANVTLLKHIKHLLYDQGLTIEGARRVLAGGSTQVSTHGESGDRAWNRAGVCSPGAAIRKTAAVLPGENEATVVLCTDLVWLKTELQALQTLLQQHNAILQSL